MLFSFLQISSEGKSHLRKLMWEISLADTICPPEDGMRSRKEAEMEEVVITWS